MAKPKQLAQSAARGWGGDEHYSKPIDDRDQLAYLKRNRQRILDGVRERAQQLLHGEGPEDWWDASDDAPAQTKQRRATWREMRDAVDSYIEAQTRFEQAYRAGIAELPNTAMTDPDDPTTDRYSAFSVRAALRTNPELTDPLVEATRRRLGFAKHPDWVAVEWDWFAYRAACATDEVEMEWLDRAVLAASDFLGNPAKQAAYRRDLEQKTTALEQSRRGHLLGADITNKGKPAKYSKRNAALLAQFETLTGNSSTRGADRAAVDPDTDHHADRAAAKDAHGKLAKQEGIGEVQIRRILSKARRERTQNSTSR